jgi:tetratricopeptide (TPR) repeat protein
MNRNRVVAGIISLLISTGCSIGHLDRSPSTIRTICDKEADFYLEKGNWDKGIALHERIIREKPQFALAHYHLGYAYGLKEEHDREIEEYEKAMQLGLKKFDLFYNAGMAYGQYLGDYDRALEIFKEAELIDPKNDEIHYALGLAYWFKEAESEAVREFLKTVNLNPRHIEAHALLGEIYARRGQYDFAKAEWEMVLELDPHNEMARTRLQEIRNVPPESR